MLQIESLIFRIAEMLSTRCFVPPVGRVTREVDWYPTIRIKVDQGIAFLNEDRPGWSDRINLASLDIRSPFTCVLAQMYGDYCDGAYRLHKRRDGALSSMFGFMRCEADQALVGSSDRYWKVLTEIWIEKIQKLRTQAS